MIGLPKSTEFNRRIPKQKFYENLSITPALRRSFIDDVRGIYWRNKLAATTLNLATGSSVTEIEVFEIQLNARSIDEAVLRQIDREIPYHILFLLSYENHRRGSGTRKRQRPAIKRSRSVSIITPNGWMNPGFCCNWTA